MSGIRETPAPDWQPIETAPKDSDLLLLSDGYEVWFGLWMKGTAFVADYWSNYEAGNGLSFPTHWMPLPEPPKVGAGT